MRKPGLREVLEFTKRWVEPESARKASKERWNSGIRKLEILIPALSLTRNIFSEFLCQLNGNRNSSVNFSYVVILEVRYARACHKLQGAMICKVLL